MRTHLAVSLGAVLWSGCFFPMGGGGGGGGGGGSTYDPPKVDKTFGSYLTLLRFHDKGLEMNGEMLGAGSTIGRIPSALAEEQPQGYDATYNVSARTGLPGMPDLGFGFLGIADGQICFEQNVNNVRADTYVDDVPSAQLAVYDYSVEALDDVDAQARRKLLPSPGSKLDSFHILDDEIKDTDTDAGIRRIRRVTYSLCGPAPAV